jgi:hypothetical protein
MLYYDGSICAQTHEVTSVTTSNYDWLLLLTNICSNTI